MFEIFYNENANIIEKIEQSIFGIKYLAFALLC